MYVDVCIYYTKIWKPKKHRPTLNSRILASHFFAGTQVLTHSPGSQAALGGGGPLPLPLLAFGAAPEESMMEEHLVDDLPGITWYILVL